MLGLLDVLGWRGAVQQRVDVLLDAAVDLLTEAAPPVTLRHAVAVAPPRPVLLIAPGEVAAEIHASRFVQAASPATVELWVVEGAGRTGGLAQAPAAWEARVTSFLARALGT